jgi:hypothetical protein
MAVRFAFILLVSLIGWAQDKSSSVTSPKTTPSQEDASSQNDQAPVKQISDSPLPTSGTSAANAAGSKKHSHSPVPEHSHTASPAPASQEKPFPIQLAGQPLDRWIRIYLIITGAAAVFGLFALVFMQRQIRTAREQSDRIARRANEQIGAMRDAAEQTDRMIQQLVEQVRIAAEQVKSATMAAWAAKTSSENVTPVDSSSVHNGHIAEEAMRLQQRAWVFVTEIRAGGLQAGKPLDITLGFKNTGRTPARNVQIATQIDSLPRGREPEPRLDKAYSRGIIPPEGTVFANIGNGNGNGSSLTQQDLQAIQSGDLVVWAYGTLTYDDVFEVRQATMFCYRLQPDGHTFAVAEIYNDAT